MELSTLDRLPATPMWAQYKSIKKDALDSLLFYRMGDFYELFFDDAIDASSILGITLTARNKNEEIPVPMCGVPFHSATSYINKLLRAGKRVAICEQTEEASAGKGIVKREIVRIVSPGMAFDHESLDSEQNNYFLVLSLGEQEGSGVYCQADISTGSIQYSSFSSLDQLRDDLALLQPKEILVAEAQLGTPYWNNFVSEVGREYFTCVTSLPNFYFSHTTAAEDLGRHFNVLNLEGFGLGGNPPALGAVGAAFRRIRDTQRLGDLKHLQPPAPKSRAGFVQLDESTMDHLDLFPKPGQAQEDSMYFHINRTATAMGARRLREILARPLADLGLIESRQEAVGELKSNAALLRRIRDQLAGMRDIERLVSKIGLRTANPRDLQAIMEIFGKIPRLKSDLRELAKSKLLLSIESKLESFEDLFHYLVQRLLDEVPAITREGNIFRTGWNKELDELITLSEDGKSFLAEMELKEREKTGINSLKIKYNKVFGYFIEITAANLANVPAHYIRKQTIANGERFLTDELKKFEDKILSAQEKRIAMEEALFDEALAKVGERSQAILKTAQELSLLDVLASFATVAQEYGYEAPKMMEGLDLHIQSGRHPALEHLVGRDKFITNSVKFSAKEKIFLITGPNMAGKSTYMRQVALITLLAHTGSFVPAQTAQIGLVDRIATRVGASDRIGRGQSTFMVEMNEMARILRQSTQKSLLIIDEIGRGTSTFDGLALAWAILEDLAIRLGCRTLFATHYHELTMLEEEFSAIKNLSVAVEQRDGHIVFLHEVKPGKASGSYGVEVARLAGLPGSVVDRANALLGKLEKGSAKINKTQKEALAQDRQLNFFNASPAPAPVAAVPEHLLSLEKSLRALNINECAPIDALLKLKSLKDGLPPSTPLC